MAEGGDHTTAPASEEDASTALPDYVLSPNAVLQDTSASWRYGRPPDYSTTRAVFENTKRMSHTAGSVPSLVENLVKNWEIEASFKTSLDDWRTIDRSNYSFSTNGLPPQGAEHMLKVGTYNALLTSNEFYCPKHSNFTSSHKTFKRMMPTFAWEVLEVYSGPPKVSFRWRHWGVMKNDYVAFNDKGEKVVAKAHGGPIELEGVSIAEVNDKLQIGKLETWYDPMTMFRQIAPHGIVNKTPMAGKIPSEAMDLVQDETKQNEQSGGPGAPKPKTMEAEVAPQPGEAIATAANTEEVKQTHEEMSKITPAECPVLMNKE